MGCFSACGNSTPTVTADQACSDVAKANCAILDRCRHNGTTVTYGNLGTCIDRQKASCMAGLTAMGTGSTPDGREACAQALPNESCQDYLQGNTIAACRSPMGQLAMGAPCAFSGQCQSAWCALVKGTNCGTCAAPPNVGDPCTDTGCWYNQACTPNAVCEAWVQTGGACDNKTLVCAPGSQCVIPSMMTMGTCQAALEMANVACDPKRQTGPACDTVNGLFCDNKTSMCTNIVYVSGTAQCGNINGIDNVCTGGGQCVSQGAGMPSNCVPPASEGGQCDTMMGPPCLAPARCVTGGGTTTSGTCMLLDPTMCM